MEGGQKQQQYFGFAIKAPNIVISRYVRLLSVFHPKLAIFPLHFQALYIFCMRNRQTLMKIAKQKSKFRYNNTRDFQRESKIEYFQRLPPFNFVLHGFSLLSYCCHFLFFAKLQTIQNYLFFVQKQYKQITNFCQRDRINISLKLKLLSKNIS